jgi:putative tryptophan/tyrosine transport system substrate-binding protein
MRRTRRREFIAGFGGVVAWPLAARAKQPAMPVVGWLHSSLDREQDYIPAFYRGLAETGFVEGRNVTVEHRWSYASGQGRALAADLVHRQVAVIVVVTTRLSLIAKSATQIIPIVFLTGDDPAEVGLVSSFNRPAGNVTGVGLQFAEISTKRLDLLQQLVPANKTIAFLAGGNGPYARTETRNLQPAAGILGVRLLTLLAQTESEVQTAFDTIVEQQAGALLIGSDAAFIGAPDLIRSVISHAARHAIPTMFAYSEAVAAGGLSSYGPDLADGYHQAGLYTGRILKGEKAADLPVMRPTKFELVINLQTAKALGLEIPPQLLARADEVME